MNEDKMIELIDKIDNQIAAAHLEYDVPIDYLSAVYLARLMVANEYTETIDRFKNTMNTALSYTRTTPAEPLH